jgi:hypothetical protein
LAGETEVLESNPDRGSGKLATNRLNYGTADTFIFIRKIRDNFKEYVSKFLIPFISVPIIRQN